MLYDDYPFAPDYEVYVNTLWALSDYTDEMGATRIIPGSHKVAKGVKCEQSDTVAAEMARGSVMIYSGKLRHGSGHNRSDRVRRALDLGYSVAWVRQEENQYLACPPDVARTLPVELLRLMGYETVRGYGHIGRDRNGGDPLTVLERSPS